MAFDILPPEILEQIFSSLSFKDAIQCALVCRKFHEIITSNMSQYYIDIWKPSDVPPTSADIKDLFVTQESIIALHQDAISIYEFHPFNKNLYLTTQCRSVPGIEVAAVMPASNCIVYSSGNRLAVYDLKKDTVLGEIELESPLEQFKCSGSAIVVGVSSYEGSRVLLYSWNGSRIDFARELNTRVNLVACDRNVVYVDNQNKRAIRVCSLRPDEDVGTSIPTANDIVELALESSGQLVSTMELVAMDLQRLVVYRTETGQAVAKLDVPPHRCGMCQYFSWMARHPFSPDSRFLVSRAEDWITVADLQTNAIVPLDISQMRKTPHTIFDRCEIDFRVIAGQTHLQILIYSLLKPCSQIWFKFDEATAGWLPVDLR